MAIELTAGAAESNGTRANALPADTAKKLRKEQQRSTARDARRKPL
jgi:hypothetical protein